MEQIATELKTSEQWMAQDYPGQFVDKNEPNGWGMNSSYVEYFCTPISYEDFRSKLLGSTLKNKEGKSYGIHIPKSMLQDGHYYLNKNDKLDLQVGKWDSQRQQFFCINGPEFGAYSLYALNHQEDGNGDLTFEPVLDITMFLNL
jgi:hypothetical protein